MEINLDAAWTAVLALATVALAIATFYLGQQARADVKAARAAEISRRSEVHINEADPIRAALIEVLYVGGTTHVAHVRVKAVGDRPVVGITATMRSDETDYSVSSVRDFLAPGEEQVFQYLVEPLIRYDDPLTRAGHHSAVGHLEIIVESHGLLGQRVHQAFRLDLEGALNGVSDVFYMSKMEIVPNVVGGSSSVTTVAK